MVNTLNYVSKCPLLSPSGVILWQDTTPGPSPARSIHGYRWAVKETWRNSEGGNNTMVWHHVREEKKYHQKFLFKSLIIIISFVFMQLTEIIFCPLASIAKLHTIPESLSHSGVTGSKEKKKDKKIYKIIKLNSWAHQSYLYFFSLEQQENAYWSTINWSSYHYIIVALYSTTRQVPWWWPEYILWSFLFTFNWKELLSGKWDFKLINVLKIISTSVFLSTLNWKEILVGN